MRNLLAEYPAWFEPDEVQILVAAFDKAWETVQASVVIYPEAKAEAARAILAKHIIAKKRRVSTESIKFFKVPANSRCE